MGFARLPFIWVTMMLLSGRLAFAQSAGQDVFVKVDASNGIAVTGATSLPVNTSARASWTVTTNECDVKVTLNLNASLPSGLTLLASLTPPRGAASIGTRPLGTTGLDFVTGITRTNESRLGITFRLEAKPSVVVAPTSRTVTYTIMSGA
jgi:hypothetical protein